MRLFPHSFSHKKYADISLSISNHLQQSWHFKITLPLCSLNTIYVLCTCKRPHELTHTNEPRDRYIAILDLDNLFDNDSIYIYIYIHTVYICYIDKHGIWATVLCNLIVSSTSRLSLHIIQSSTWTKTIILKQNAITYWDTVCY